MADRSRDLQTSAEVAAQAPRFAEKPNVWSVEQAWSAPSV